MNLDDDEIEELKNINGLHLIKKKYLSNSLLKISTKKRKNTKQVIEHFRQIHGHKYDYSKVKYVNNKTKLIIICKKHGEFIIEFHKHLKLGCNKCHLEKMALIYDQTNKV